MLREKCVDGLEADEERCREGVEKSLAAVTALVPLIGYDAAARLAHRASDEQKTVREIAQEEGIAPGELASLLDPMRMTEPGVPTRPRKP